MSAAGTKPGDLDFDLDLQWFVNLELNRTGELHPFTMMVPT